MSDVLVADHLVKKFGKFQALKNITMSIHAGEVFGFIGPNGAGKSTTIRTLLGILRPTSGSAKIFGRDVWRDAVTIHQRIAYVPGDVHLWPNLTGGEIIDLLLRLNGDQHSAKTDRLIKDFELDVSKKSCTYSRGNRQKVALVAALSSEADFYIFDEPTSGLDPIMEEVFQKYVLSLKEAGKSVLLSSHILSEVERMCDRIAIIRKGQIIEVGSLAEMRQLSRSTVHVSTRKPLLSIRDMKGVHQFETKSARQGVFSVDSEYLGQVISALAILNIIQLQSTPPTLEDLFLRYYNEEGDLSDSK